MDSSMVDSEASDELTTDDGRVKEGLRKDWKKKLEEGSNAGHTKRDINRVPIKLNKRWECT
jgi:hypothetical protein